MIILTYTLFSSFFFFFNDTATTEIYTLSLHDALPIFSIDPDPPGGPDDGDPLVPVSEGALIDVAILDNRIEAMGVCGISVARFFDLSRTPEYISIEGLEIAHNRISSCVRLEAPLLSANLNVHS